MFSPYHRLGNCQKLRRAITTLSNNNSVTNEVLRGYKRYHFALEHKLKSVTHRLNQMEGLVNRASPQEVVSSTSDFMFNINMAIDGYFQSGGSVLDILAREVLTYFGESLPSAVYFGTAKNILNRNRHGDSILQRLNDPFWKQDFSMYRNALTHEVIIAGNFNLGMSVDGNTEMSSLMIPLPDDPRIDPTDRTFRKYPDVLAYTQDCFRKILRLVNQIYGEITTRANANGSLPL